MRFFLVVMEEEDMANLSLGMFWNLSKMIVTLILKTQLLVMKIHTLLVREFETMTTLFIMMLLCWLVMLLMIKRIVA
jgi:hypothetical protein